ncbi:beta-1,3-galactosyltransferase [Pyxidicoccus fallax]|uniref:Beta-1,3-galactosyltransferase n=1 Tax=Pyxidicoccus fallax TaxID=394095 RepID=A0A848LQZ7_9BACT|nr:beta-eliminating lyase-related protein [Pyxidicoccus fallax]NMO20099.1 beta-1,3-galactosyltransferase [Pyxidicoccus fallax]NPC82573.1 beta-1,3-galactosyltransferase [Pyxidicoccus fallax]
MNPRQLSRGEFLALTGLLSGSTLLRGTAQAATPPPPAPVGKAAAGAGPSRAEMDALRRGCRASLAVGGPTDAGDELIRVGEWVKRQGLSRDFYGSGDFVQAFEKRVADLLGFEDGCYMPTGTMGQLIVLRMYADASGNRRVGLHPSSHHVLHESDSHAVLHGLREVFISPWSRPVLASDVREAREPLGSVSVELPVRWLGGQLQTWEQLEELKSTCRDKRVKLHMDGARLWESQPFYGRSYADICKGFDSVYVSFYKMVGALGGAMVLGGKDFIRDARTWRHRHGGNLFQMLPYVASAAMRLDDVLARIPGYVKRAKSLTEAMAADTRITVLPRPVQTNMFRVFLRGDAAALTRQRDVIAREDKVWVANGFGPTRVPGVVETELQVGEGLGTIKDADAARAFSRLLDAKA